MLVLGQWELPQKCEMTKYHEFYQLIILKDDIASRKCTNDILQALITYVAKQKLL